tara:strand:+ start:253 stop:462 length:210 start_codon:yes stop_codon:yes gene_type:complete
MEGITTLFFIMKILLLLPLLLGFSVPAIAHNETNGGCGSHCTGGSGIGEREGAEPPYYSLPSAGVDRDF